MNPVIRLNPADNVVIALKDIGSGTVVDGLTLKDPVPRGHKIAADPIPKGANVLRYGQIIGAATVDIPAGSHIHTHNLAMAAHTADYAYSTDLRPLPLADKGRT